MNELLETSALENRFGRRVVLKSQWENLFLTYEGWMERLGSTDNGNDTINFTFDLYGGKVLTVAYQPSVYVADVAPDIREGAFGRYVSSPSHTKGTREVTKAFWIVTLQKGDLTDCLIFPRLMNAYTYQPYSGSSVELIRLSIFSRDQT